MASYGGGQPQAGQYYPYTTYGGGAQAGQQGQYPYGPSELPMYYVPGGYAPGGAKPAAGPPEGPAPGPGGGGGPPGYPSPYDAYAPVQIPTYAGVEVSLI